MEIMATYRPPIISNRFEIVILILLCFVISTRLIWLQIDDRHRVVTDQFYATSLLFKAAKSAGCPVAIDPSFPFNSPVASNFLDSGAVTSPGLGLAFLGICQYKRLSLDQFQEYAPIFIGVSTFLVALTARVLTSNWVGGMIAAAVVLSRGTLLQGTHLAGAFWVLQACTSLTLFFLALYSRVRHYVFLPAVIIGSVISTYVSPLVGVIVWALNAAVLIRLLYQVRSPFAKSKRIRQQLLPVAVGLVCIPLLVYFLHRVEPSSTQAVGVFFSQLRSMTQGWKAVLSLISAAMAVFEQQDLHWLLSVAVIAMACTWKRFLPRGSGFWSIALCVATIIAVIADGGITAQATKQASALIVRRYYNMTDAVFALEPMIIGAAASYAWFAVRYIIILIFPAYISVSHQRNNMK